MIEAPRLGGQSPLEMFQKMHAPSGISGRRVSQ